MFFEDFIHSWFSIGPALTGFLFIILLFIGLLFLFKAKYERVQSVRQLNRGTVEIFFWFLILPSACFIACLLFSMMHQYKIIEHYGPHGPFKDSISHIYLAINVIGAALDFALFCWILKRLKKTLMQPSLAKSLQLCWRSIATTYAPKIFMKQAGMPDQVVKAIH